MVALEDTSVCRTGELGTVLCQNFTPAGRPDWIIQFAGGGQDGWSPCEAGLWLRPVST